MMSLLAATAPASAAPAAAPLPLYGSVPCTSTYTSGIACRNKAYYYTPSDCHNNIYRCGVHADPATRRKLPQLSDWAKRKAAKAAQALRDTNVALYRMHMMTAVAHRTGYQTVFPNNKHAKRSDGIGMATLSPMQLGPVVHGQKGIPDALNLENFHQQSKQLVGESDAAFLAAQTAGFLDPVAHRHKVKGALLTGWVWVDPASGQRHVLKRVESRQFYCNYYERLARKTQEWKDLEALVAGGTSVMLCGYDGRAMPDIEAAYLNESFTFGHEAVLYTMLHSPDPTSWPWRKYKTFAF